DSKTTCRKCRFDRFCYVLATCSDEAPLVCSCYVMPRSGFVPAEPSPFLDHETCFDGDVACQQTHTLNRMKIAYGVLCMMRKNGEMGT
ncbi:hypothetical protein PENTCL1PPCAC_14906, partial [Pristionchus entomophagus]